MKATCAFCGSEFEILTGAYNRAIKKGLNLYCNRTCSGLGRQLHKPTELKKKEKALYDKNYREVNKESRAIIKAQWHKENYDAERQRNYNRDHYRQHLEYLNRREYKDYKREYDRKYLANKHYGEFADAAIILRTLELSIDRYAMNLVQEIPQQKNRKKLWKHLQQPI